jgi:hypothetical protein
LSGKARRGDSILGIEALITVKRTIGGMTLLRHVVTTIPSVSSDAGTKGVAPEEGTANAVTVNDGNTPSGVPKHDRHGQY